MPDLLDNPPKMVRDLDALERLVSAVVGSAVLTPPWFLRTVIAHDRELRGPVFSVPHAESHVLSRRRLLQIAKAEDLPLIPEPPPTTVIILLPRPDVDWLTEAPDAEILLRYWRLLFHARVDQETQRRLGDGNWVPLGAAADLQRRIERLGRDVFHEARFVLQREQRILNGADDRDVYAEFAATYLELHHFAPRRLAYYFPATAGDPSRVLSAILVDVDDAVLLRETRLEGAPASPLGEPAEPPADEAEDVHVAPSGSGTQRHRSDRRRREILLRWAARAAGAGNVVRSAVLRTRVYLVDPAAAGARAQRDEAVGELDVLIDRLRAVLDFDDASRDRWRQCLRPLLPQAARGWWNREAKLLYDLQKVCVDHEREIYSVNVVEWLLERCRRPLRRPQPGQRLVLVCKHLRSALGRVRRVRLTPGRRDELAELLRGAIHAAEHHLRGSLRPSVERALEAGAMRPANAVERVARAKLVGELLDALAQRGYLNLGNLRDAISRNQIKFDDLRNPAEFFTRDPLLRVNYALRDQLDGVYHSGEVYMRWFQRLSSLLFATRTGRLLTRLVIAPLAGSFLLLEALDHTLGLLINKLIGSAPPLAQAVSAAAAARAAAALDAVGTAAATLVSRHVAPEHIHFNHRPVLIGVALFLMGIINWPAFRRQAARAGSLLLRGAGRVLIDAPAWLLSRPLVRAFFNSGVVRSFVRYVLKPAPFALLTWWLVPRHHHPVAHRVAVIAVFLAFDVGLNSPFGRTLEEALLHWLRLAWARLTGNILAGMLRAVVYFFERLLEDLDRMLYAVDEWLRFRSGQRRASLVLKAVLGVFWFYVAYATRFCVNLLFEPQINPLKHFPVVTVSHKLILPLAITKRSSAPSPLASLLMAVAPLLRVEKANAIAATVVWGIPGIFGFLAWELRENWKLYRANRAAQLKPVQVGSHGESMARLLRPGIHSGTLPKVFARLRRASARTGRRGALHAHMDALEHVREAVEHFLCRDLVALLNQHPAWRQAPVQAGPVRLAVTRIELELCCATIAVAPLRLSIEQQVGWVVGAVEARGWADAASPRQQALLEIALTGFFRMCGCDVVRDRVARCFGSRDVRFEMRRGELIVWPTDDPGRRIRYELADSTLSPHGDAADASWPTLHLCRLMFGSEPVDWAAWVRTWDGTAEPPVDALAVPAVALGSEMA